jgi:hypothetical protein
MTWYSGTHACGHEGEAKFTDRNRRRRDWRAEIFFAGNCEACRKKEREETNKRAAEIAKEMGLPALEGTEKQIEWATTLRQQFIDGSKRLDGDERSLRFAIVRYITQNMTKASYWIDNRDESAERIISQFKHIAGKTDEEVDRELEEKKRIKRIAEEAKLESTVFPEIRRTNVPVEIAVRGRYVTASFEKEERFRNIIYEMGYRWDYDSGYWRRYIDNLAGNPDDRAAELGNKMLNKGYPICIYDEDIRKKAVEGSYEPECERWIVRKDKEHLGIWWKGFSDTLYIRSRSLPGAKWKEGAMWVNIAHHKEIADFARLYNFQFTKKSLKAIEEYKLLKQRIPVVTPAKVEEQKDDRDTLKEMLDQGAEVLDDLIDG